MAKRGRPVTAVVLTDEERDTLQRWARRPKSAQALAQRCRIVLGCAAGKSNKEVAAELGVSQQMVCKWRGRFVADRLDGLADEPRPGAPRTIGDEQIEAVVVATLERQPANATHWSTRVHGQAGGPVEVDAVAGSGGLRPAAASVETFKLSNDPLFVEKVHDVVGLYLDPPERALVLCVDEKSQIQALDRSAPVLPMMPGCPSAVPTTTCATASPRCSPPWMWPRARSRLPPPPASRQGVQEVPGQARQGDPGRPRCPPDLRQLRHPQTPAV